MSDWKATSVVMLRDIPAEMMQFAPEIGAKDMRKVTRPALASGEIFTGAIRHVGSQPYWFIEGVSGWGIPLKGAQPSADDPNGPWVYVDNWRELSPLEMLAIQV